MRRLVLTGLAVGISAFVRAQNPVSAVGGDMVVSGALAGDQTFPSLSFSSSVGYAVWQDNNLGGAAGIGLRRLDLSGAPLDPIQRVNTSSAMLVERPQVAALPSGAAVVWQAGTPGRQGVFLRVLDTQGNGAAESLVSQPLFSATNRTTVTWKVMRNNRASLRRFRIVRTIDHRRHLNANPAVAALADGSIIVAYGSYVRYATNEPIAMPQITFYGNAARTNSFLAPYATALDNMQDVYLQRFTSTGARLGGEVLANQTVRFNQRDPAVAPLKNGGFVVTWVTEQREGLPPRQTGASSLVNVPEIYARVFDNNAAAITPEFVVSTSAAGTASPAVAAVDGGFRVVWAQKADGWDVFSRTFTTAGQAVSAPTRVNTQTTGDQFSPRIVSYTGGELVAWASMGHDRARIAQLLGIPAAARTPQQQAELNTLQAAWDDLFAQAYAAGVPTGAEFRVNEVTAGRQLQPTVAALPGGGVLVGWAAVQPATGHDILARQLSQ